MGFLGAAIAATRLVLEGEARIDAIGVMCAGLNIIMYASPLSAMVINYLRHLIIVICLIPNLKFVD